MDSSKLYFIGGLTTAALAGVYIFWGPSERARRKKAWVNGLQNLGNTCFLNAVLQALAPCASIGAWVSDRKTEPSVLTFALSDVLRGLNTNTECKSASYPSQVLSALQKRNWVITSHEQDAHELFHALTTTLQEELVIQQSPLSLLDVHKVEEERKPLLPGVLSRVCGSQLPTTPNLLGRWTLPTKGLIACRLVCQTCGFRNSVRYDSFDSISLTLPEHFWGGLKLDQCLKQWALAELIPDVICAGCSRESPGIKQRSTFTKQLCFGRLPACLCLHLMRTVWHPMGTPCKRYEHVSFPEYLSLNDYISKPARYKTAELPKFHTGLLGGTSQATQTINSSAITAGEVPVLNPFVHRETVCNSSAQGSKKLSVMNHLYQLKSVIVHLGDTFSGHFITYRRGGQQNNLWFCVSDMSVRQVSCADVFKASAYMLFYEKM